MAQLRASLKQMTPKPIVRRLSQRKLKAMRARNSSRSAEVVFDEVYRLGMWGDPLESGLKSGTGSRGQAPRQYADAVTALIVNLDVHSIVDVGCGDFQVARQFAAICDSYLGLDVARAVIDHNRRVYGTDAIRFRQLNAAEERVPSADLCMIRQVLQHLSNAEIAAVLANVAHIPTVVITEHWPASLEGSPNADKAHGPDTRLASGSWVDLTEPPFDLTLTELLRAPAGSKVPGETLRTFVWNPPSSDPSSPDGE